MALFTKALDNVLVVVNQASSPGTGWSAAANLQAVFSLARSNGLQLVMRPGVYPTTALAVSTGSAGSLRVTGVPGSVTIQLTSGDNLLAITGVYDCQLEGIIFDGNNVAFSNIQDSSALLRLDNSLRISVSNCQFINSTRCGIYITNGSTPIVRGCYVSNCNYGIWSVDALSTIDANTIQNCQNNGILVWRSTVTGDSSSITNNVVGQIASGSGTGQNGNGISVFRAVAVNISGNRISGCQYSSVRCNGGGDAIITENNCYNSREVAIFVEAPLSGINFNGGVVANNMIDNAGSGISVANSGFGGQGVARSVAVTGNRVSGVVKRTINDPGYVPTVSNAFGISVEGDSMVSGNIVDSAAGFGIVAGINNGTKNLNIAGNLVVGSNVGIGYSSQSGAGQVAITGNMIQGAAGGSIVSVYLDNSSGNLFRVTGSTDYGNQSTAQIGNIYLASNRSY